MKARGQESTALPDDVAEVLRVRAERLRGAASRDDDASETWVAEFPLGEDHFGLPLETLRAVLPVSVITAVPLSPPHVVGVLRFDRSIVAVMSLASLLGSRGWRQDPTVVLVVDPGWGRLAALDCEAVPRAVPIRAAAIEAARAGAGDGPVMEIVSGDREPLQLLDLRKLLELRRGDRHGR